MVKKTSPKKCDYTKNHEHKIEKRSSVATLVGINVDGNHKKTIRERIYENREKRNKNGSSAEFQNIQKQKMELVKENSELFNIFYNLVLDNHNIRANSRFITCLC